MARPPGASSAWTISTWLACLFPDHVQDEVFATENVRVCGVLSPTAEATPVEGGVVVNGAWHFISGARHSLWQVIIAMAPTPDGSSMWPVMAVVPLSDLQIVDDWNTMGLRGHRQRHHGRPGRVRAAGPGAADGRRCCRSSSPPS